MFNRQMAQQVANGLYAVFLGFTLSSFYVIKEIDGGDYSVHFFSGVKWLIVFLLIIYYVLDWFTTIFLLEKDKQITHRHMFLLLSAMVALCYTILLSINGGFEQFIIFGIYSLIVPLWDVIITADDLKSTSGNHKEGTVDSSAIKLKFVLGFRFYLGIILCIPIVLLTWKGADSSSIELTYFVYFMVTLIVIAKWVRMELLFKVYE